MYVIYLLTSVAVRQAGQDTAASDKSFLCFGFTPDDAYTQGICSD